MINFFKKLIKYTVVYPLVLIFTVSLVITVYHSITVGIPIAFEQANEETAIKEKTSIQEKDVAKNNIVVTKVKQEPRETEKHKQCRLKLHSENPYGGNTLVWDTKDFGTYDDGSVWVGYNRKTGNKVWYNLSKIC